MGKRHYFCLLSALGLGAIAACGRSAFVVQTFPGDGEVIAATDRVGVEFAEPMDQESTETQFHIEPIIDGHYYWEGNTLWFVPTNPFAPEITYTAILESRAVTQDGMQLARALSWQFNIREPAIVYLAQRESTIVLWQEQTAEVSRLSPELEGEILAYAFANGGSNIIYVVGNRVGGSDLVWSSRSDSSFQVLVDCGADRCTEPTWSQRTGRVAYSRAFLSEAAVSTFDSPRLWTVEPSTGQTSELLQDDHVLIGGPLWSPNGNHLAFYDALVSGIRIITLAGGEDSILPSGYGVIGSWSPEGERMVFPVLKAAEDGFSISLHLASLTSQETTIVVDENVNFLDFGLPSWSPDGSWIVVGIQSAQHGLGKQLWLMKSDGSGLHPIVLEPTFAHGGYRWDPNSEKILFQRFHLDDPSAAPEVWLWSMEDEQVELIAQNAWQPGWLP